MTAARKSTSDATECVDATAHASRGSFGGDGAAAPEGWPREQGALPARVRGAEFDVPLAHAGVVALLMRADLASQQGADRFLATFTLPSNVRPPTLRQLRLAQAIGRGIDYAIRYGNGPQTWELLQRAYDAIQATMPKRAVVVSILRDVCAYDKRDVRFREQGARRGRPQHLDGPGEGLAFRAEKALQVLHGIDSRFAAIDLTMLLGVVKTPKLEAIGAAAKLSILSGAFEDGPRENESEAAAFKRVKKLYEKSV